MNIQSKLWRLRTYPGGDVHITQLASGITRPSPRSEIPHPDRLAAMTENQFNALCREAFHYIPRRGI